jgi:hypothetical protein
VPLEVSEAVDQYGIEVSNVNGIIRRGLHTGVDHPKRFRMFRFMFDGLIETSKASSGLPCIGVLHERRERPLLRVCVASARSQSMDGLPLVSPLS